MDNITLNRVLKQFINTKYNYLGIFTISQLSTIDTKKYKYLALILFIPNISKILGHWTVLIKVKNNIYFLDSFGLNPKLYNFDLKHTFKSKIKYNYYYLNVQIQSNSSTTCGAYAIYFIHTMILCKYNIICLKKKINKHLKNRIKSINDNFVIQYMYDYFKNSLPNNCQKLFCNNKFITNRKLCIQTICKRKF